MDLDTNSGVLRGCESREDPEQAERHAQNAHSSTPLMGMDI